MDEAFSAAWHGYTPAQGSIFRIVAHALIHNLPISFNYHAPSTGKTTNRTAEPHHLQHYMASWVLVAWCRLRNDWRKLYLARMNNVTMLEKPFQPKHRSEWQPLLEESFGIFQGSDPVPVTLRFTPFRARWIREQIWHPEQRIHENPGGGLELSLPVADFREIKLKVLQFGADCEVVSPPELRAEVAREIKRMAAVYQ